MRHEPGQHQPFAGQAVPPHRPPARTPARRFRPGTRPGDPRWRALVAALSGLREGGRYSIRIVDIDCGQGTLLLRAVRHARALGFTAIEGRGTDRDPHAVSCALAAAAVLRDPAIGLTFEVLKPTTVLAEEANVPADILLCRAPRPALAVLVARASRQVLTSECSA